MQQPHQQQASNTMLTSASRADSSWKMTSLSSQQQTQDATECTSSTTNFHPGYNADQKARCDITDKDIGVEERCANGLSQDHPPSSNSPSSHYHHLALKQLERFRMAIQKANKAKSNRWTAKTMGTRTGKNANENDDATIEFDNLFMENTKSNPTSTGTTSSEFKIITYPWTMWIFGSCIIISTSIYMNHISKNRFHRNTMKKMNAEENNWWKYLVGCVVYFIGIALLLNGRVETFCMNKELQRLFICTTKPLCLIKPLKKEKKFDRDLRQIIDVRVEAMGEFTGDIDTRSYQIHIDFEDGTYVTCLEARSKTKTMKRCRMIQHFIRTSCGNNRTSSGSKEHQYQGQKEDLESSTNEASICSMSSYEEVASYVSSSSSSSRRFET